MNFRLSPTELLIAVLAVWRGTHLLWGEDGPFEIFLRLRKLAGRGFFGELLDCFYCLSLWIALPIAWLIGATGPNASCCGLASRAAQFCSNESPLHARHRLPSGAKHQKVLLLPNSR